MSRAGDAPIEVERDFAADLPPVPLDADMCEQVFTNLFLNAYEAMGSEGGKLRVDIAPADSLGRSGVEVAPGFHQTPVHF